MGLFSCWRRKSQPASEIQDEVSSSGGAIAASEGWRQTEERSDGIQPSA